MEDEEVKEFPIEQVYYDYCFVLNRSEEEFFNSTFSKVFWVLEEHRHRNNAEREQEQEEVCTTMKQFLR